MPLVKSTRQADSWLTALLVITCLLLSPLTLASTTQTSTTIIKSSNDERDYLAFTLDNGLRALVISDPRADQAAASLDLDVGSGDDPKAHPGLAHFLEHMLFLGTEKYPEADAYQAFISSHGGSHNAFTAHDHTNYFFNVDQQYLPEALDRFAQFFIAPLFTPQYVDREKHAVHSEYQSKLKEDSRRGYSVFKQVLNPEHPMSHFAVGSLDTLADGKDQSVREALLTFYDDHYSADRMTLVVLGKEDVSTLKALVEQGFTAVKQQPTLQQKVQVPLFKPGQLPALVRVKSIQEKYKLNFTFPVPALEPHYRSKPLHYISSMMGDEGPGSLLDVLKQQGWAQGLSAGPGLSLPDAATFMISISLTPEGYQQVKEVSRLTFDYIQLIKQQGVSQQRFDEEQALSELSFRFQDEVSPASYVTHLAHNLRRYPLAETIHGDYLFADYQPRLIHQYLDQLSPANALLTLTSAHEETRLVEPWFQTPYDISPLDASYYAEEVADSLQSRLALPAANPFIPKDLSLRQQGATEKPRLIAVQPGFRLWHQLDLDFPSPKADFYFTFRSPNSNNSAIHHVMTKLFVDLVQEQLNSFIYPAQVAGQEVNLYEHVRGFSLRLSGYRDKQPLLLSRITETLKNLKVDPQRLQLAKESLRRAIENKHKDKPYHQTLNQVYEQLLMPRWDDQEQLEALQWITQASLQDFLQQLFSEGEIEALAHGNLSKAEALTLAEPLKQNLLEGLQVTSVADAAVKLIPAKGIKTRIDVPHSDAAITYYVQAPERNMASLARYQLLEQILGTAFYSQLRTQEQLGYIVFASALPVIEQPGLAFVVQSPVADADQLEARIDQFIHEQQSLLNGLSASDLQTYKASLLAELLKREQTLKERSNRYWRELDRGYIDFDSREWRANAIRQTTLEDLQQTLPQLMQHQLIIKADPQIARKSP